MSTIGISSIKSWARQLRAARQALGVEGQLAAKLVDCPTCKAPRGAWCHAIGREKAHWPPQLHAGRAKAAADYIEAPMSDG